MPQICSVCSHKERGKIDDALIGGAKGRRIAAQFGLSETSLRRHRADHLPEHLAKAHDADTASSASDLLAKIAHLETQAKRITAKAEEDSELATALRGLRELSRLIELLARLRGELQEGFTVNIVQSPDWVRLRGILLAALRPFPEAKLAIARAIEQANAGDRPREAFASARRLT